MRWPRRYCNRGLGHVGLEVWPTGQRPRCTACGHRVPYPGTGGGLVIPVPTRRLGWRAWLPELAARRRARRWPLVDRWPPPGWRRRPG